MAKAIDKARAHATKENEEMNQIVPVGSETLAKVKRALYEDADASTVREGGVDFSVVEGLDPSMPVATSLSKIVNETLAIVSLNWVTNQFYDANDNSRNREPLAAEVIFQMSDGLFGRAVAGNVMIVKQSRVIEKLLSQFEWVLVKVAEVEVKGQANKAVCFRGTDGFGFSGKNDDLPF